MNYHDDITGAIIDTILEVVITIMPGEGFSVNCETDDEFDRITVLVPRVKS